MLVGIDLTNPKYTKLYDQWAKVAEDGRPWPFGPYSNPSLGVYEVHLNFNYDIQYAIKNEFPFDRGSEIRPLYEEADKLENYEEKDVVFEKIRKIFKEMRDAPNDYGMCDNWEQVLKEWPEIVTSDRKFLLAFTEMGDHRPHKFGAYIGVHDEYTMHENFRDCKTIDQVFAFHIYEIKDEYAILP